MNPSPRERADKVRNALERYRGDGTLLKHGAAVAAIKLLPPGSLVLTAAEAETVGEELERGGQALKYLHYDPDTEALALLSPEANVDSKREAS